MTFLTSETSVGVGDCETGRPDGGSANTAIAESPAKSIPNEIVRLSMAPLASVRSGRRRGLSAEFRHLRRTATQSRPRIDPAEDHPPRGRLQHAGDRDNHVLPNVGQPLLDYHH